MRKTPAPYIHHPHQHGPDQPSALVPYLVQRFRPRSVIDVGCGVGNFLAKFREFGALVHGVDGPWADTTRHLQVHEFTEADLTKPLNLGRRFDLALSLEVAEHLPPEAADTLVATLVSLADRIVFSAAVPGQGGQNHLNEQCQSFWAAKFSAHGYGGSQDLARDIWTDERIFYWYRQNIVLYERDRPATEILDIAHPAMLTEKQAHHYSVMEGHASLATYVLMLWKWLRSR